MLHTGRGVKGPRGARNAARAGLRGPAGEGRPAPGDGRRGAPHRASVGRRPAGRGDRRPARGRTGLGDAPGDRAYGGRCRTAGRADEPFRRPVRSSRPASSSWTAATGRTGGGGDLLRLYLRVADADAAPELWHGVLSALESRSVTYRAKIISNPSSLPRNDGMVVYLGSGSWDAVDAVTESALATGRRRARPAFAHVVAPGVTAAWEPKDDRTGMRGLSSANTGRMSSRGPRSRGAAAPRASDGRRTGGGVRRGERRPRRPRPEPRLGPLALAHGPWDHAGRRPGHPRPGHPGTGHPRPGPRRRVTGRAGCRDLTVGRANDGGPTRPHTAGRPHHGPENQARTAPTNCGSSHSC
ncbi:T3SS effector HopA1 family protein [Streptomyces thinghirensis]|nr:T3SS effector HopA1 family protein [Streptomyces thinghirensis]